MGYGVIRVIGQKVEYVAMDAIKFNSKRTPFQRLGDIHRAVDELIKEFCPDELAMEAPFFGKNVQSMLKLGRAQGVILSAGLNHGLAIDEYSPRRVKQVVTGKGAASKEMVSGMLQATYELKELPKLMDATDALAVATCHAYTLLQVVPASAPKRKSTASKSSSWDAFLAANPDRIAGKD